jgi:hypothetical protein
MGVCAVKMLTRDDIIRGGACISGVDEWLRANAPLATALSLDDALALCSDDDSKSHVLRGANASGYVAGNGYGNGDSYGNGDGYGYGYGYGDGGGYGYGDGGGDGYGNGNGYGYGDGGGYGDGQ